MDTAVPVLAQVDGRAHAGREAARLLDDRIVFRPGERARRACELRMSRVQHLRDQFERAPSVLHPVRATRVLEELERLLERRILLRLGLGFRLGLGLGFVAAGSR